jgi:hypothetical protein
LVVIEAMDQLLPLSVFIVVSFLYVYGLNDNEYINIPNRERKQELTLDPPSLNEIETNITLYLQTLHRELGSVAGRYVDALQVWEKYLNVTISMIMLWDDQNKNRYFTPRDDDSIYVALGTYRDPFCPMTIKSLYNQAKYPDRLFVGLFQQNCFEKVCRTGVLKGYHITI